MADTAILQLKAQAQKCRRLARQAQASEAKTLTDMAAEYDARAGAITKLAI